MSPSPSPTGRRRLSKEERAALAAPLPESYRSLSQPEIDALWRTGSKVEQRRLGREGLLPSWLLVRATNRAGITKAQVARAEKTLDTRIRLDDGRVVTRREFLEDARRQGALLKTWRRRQEKKEEALALKLQYMDRGFSIPHGNPNHPDTIEFNRLKKMLKDGIYTEEFIIERPDGVFHVIGKTEADYFTSLSGGEVNRAGQIINPYPGESAGKAVFGSSRKYDDEIREAMARAFFVDWYASEQERRQEEGLKANIARGGEDWMDVAPGTSRAAKKHAREYAVKLSAANKGATLTDLYAAALNAGGTGDARTFGHYMAMQAMGHGVSWFDDNPEFPIEVPHGEFYQ